jgi:glucosamine--fructose-6-phosphate aminotransferase (isomerizing)
VQAPIKQTDRFIFLEEGDAVEIRRDGIAIHTADGAPVQRIQRKSELSADAVERGEYHHYMRKEIFEQPRLAARSRC